MSESAEPFRTSRLSYEDIRAHAERFLDKYHANRTIPVPIAEIVEFDLSMDIIPVSGLRAEIDVDAFLSSDGDRVFMDEGAMRNSLPRFRFSLAHEAGHYWLHDDFYQRVTIASVADWKVAQQQIALDYRWFEFQANSFAGLVLVPTATLRQEFDRSLADAIARGLSAADIQEHPLRARFIQGLADRFEVSAATMERRLEKDGLLAELLIPGFDS